ncbi:MAG: flagellar biosynthesis protein FlhF [Pseudomonadales bacterium]|nr:flagellar biosynthesis protein FlhF [Pseudomonadales bacterium]
MKVRRFVAPDMRRALNLVRDELGDDAFILSNKSVADGIEVLASLEAGALAISSEARKTPVTTRVANSTRANVEARSNPSTGKKHLTNDQLNKTLLNANRAKRPVTLDKPKVRQAQGQAQDQDQIRGQGQNDGKSTSAGSTRNFGENSEIARLMLELEDAKKQLADNRAVAESPFVNANANANGNEWERENKVENVENVETVYQGSLGEVAEDESNFMEETDLLDPQRNRAMEVELKQLRDLLTLQMGEAMWGNMSYKKPIHAQVLKRLHALGLTNKLCKQVVKSLPDGDDIDVAWRRALVKMTKQIPIASQDIIEAGGVIALVGPTGAGKTTTIAKLAASYVLQHGAEDLAIVTTDTYRIAAHEQLKTLGRILSVPIHIVSEDKSLNEILQELGHKHLVLVDTAGLARGDTGRHDQIQQLKDCQARIRNYLVLATTHQLQVQRSAVSEFKGLPLCGCILTKLDETSSLGESISVLFESKLPVAYLSDGQKIPDDIHLATAPKLMSKAVSMMNEKEVDELEMSALVGSIELENIQPPLALAYARNG